MGQVRESFIEPLLRVFSPQRTDDVEGWMSAYEGVLRTFSDETLQLAAHRIIAHRDVRSFPLPAECNHACKEAIDIIGLERKRESRPDNGAETRNLPVDKQYPEWSERAVATANRLFTCELARQALKEDWGLSLHDWMRERGRTPDRYEAEEIRTKGLILSRKFWEAVGAERDAHNSEPNLLMRKFIKMRQQKIDRLRNIAFGGDL